MLAAELITDDVPPLRPTETAEKALRWMDEFKVNHLPIVDKRKYIGIISETELLDLPSNREDAIENTTAEISKICVTENQHIFEVVKVISEQGLSIMPVLSEKDEYLGSITISHLMDVIADMSIVSDIGGVIVLEMNVNDYHLSEIARIVEDNNARILGTFITSHTDSTKMQVTVKVNIPDLQGILQTFDRFGYTVAASYDYGSMKDDMKDRFDQFMSWMSI